MSFLIDRVKHTLNYGVAGFDYYNLGTRTYLKVVYADAGTFVYSEPNVYPVSFKGSGKDLKKPSGISISDLDFSLLNTNNNVEVVYSSKNIYINDVLLTETAFNIQTELRFKIELTQRRQSLLNLIEPDTLLISEDSVTFLNFNNLEWGVLPICLE